MIKNVIVQRLHNIFTLNRCLWSFIKMCWKQTKNYKIIAKKYSKETLFLILHWLLIWLQPSVKLSLYDFSRFVIVLKTWAMKFFQTVWCSVKKDWMGSWGNLYRNIERSQRIRENEMMRWRDRKAKCFRGYVCCNDVWRLIRCKL